MSDITPVSPPGSLRDGPVGVFDSGVGGLTVLRAIRDVLPTEPLLYCADTAHAPYGGRSDAYVVDRTLAVAQWLQDRGAKAIVVACNTATTIAIETLRQNTTLPVVGVEPGVKPAVAASRSGVAGILATAATLRSAKFARLIDAFAQSCTLLCMPGVGLVEAVEAGDLNSPAVDALLRRCLSPLLDGGADTLALGCTHYPFLIPAIERIAGGRLHIVDNSTPVARQLDRELHRHGLHRPATGHADASDESFVASTPGTIQLFATGNVATLEKLAAIALGHRVAASQHDILLKPADRVGHDRANYHSR